MAFGAGLAFRAGWAYATLTETQVINRYAAQYVAETGVGALVTDCVAVPGVAQGVWITVQCARANAPIRTFHINRFGVAIAQPRGTMKEPSA